MSLLRNKKFKLISILDALKKYFWKNATIFLEQKYWKIIPCFPNFWQLS